MHYAKLCKQRCVLPFVFAIQVVLFLGTDAAQLVHITYVKTAVEKGAVCLDGSPPAYYFSPGFGSGVDSWLVNIEGGGWCNNVTTCLQRMKTDKGSSKYMSKQTNFSAILSNNRSLNPDFYNWNKARVWDCDGSSFTGNIHIVNSATKLNYRGARIWDAVMEALLDRGLHKAKNVLLGGNSAGGLAAILHCDNFRALFTPETNVKCFSDAGFFINGKDISGKDYIADYFDEVVTTHGSAKSLPSSCTANMPPSLCFFPQNVILYMKTPLFILNSAYDAWQIQNVLVPSVADPTDSWQNCTKATQNCSSSQLDIIQGFRKQFLNALGQTGYTASRGWFINSCFVHTQSTRSNTWLSPHSPMLANITIANAVGDWYYGRREFQEIDCPYPCDTTCVDHP